MDNLSDSISSKKSVTENTFQVSSSGILREVDYIDKMKKITPLTTEWKASESLNSHSASLPSYKDFFWACILFLFRDRCCPSNELKELEQLSVTHLDCYMQKFNQDDNGAAFLSPNFSMLERNGKDWNEKDGISTVSFFSRLISNFKENNPNIIPKDCPIETPGELRKTLENSGKNILALPINLSTGIVGRHWTMIHFNFKDKTISYIDSVKPNKEAEKVNERLQQALIWIKKIDKDPSWKINKPDNNNAQPSILAESKQQDFWNCGIFALHFTALAGKGKTYAEMDKISPEKMYQGIGALRLEVMDRVNKTFN